jgi:1,4-dihydroxy-6-naphthoate synthase
MALESRLDVTKISYHAFGRLREHYALLRSGSALGRGCGPLIVAKSAAMLEDLNKGMIAIPGELTTASLLLHLYDPSLTNVVVMPFERIMDTVARGEVTAGLIIHESRFTYPLYKLEKLLDLGEWWEKRSGLPIPLGGILGKRSLGKDVLLKVEAGIRDSIQYAHANIDEVLAYCGQHSREMDREVMKKHIDLYVNDFSLDLGKEGLDAVRRLLYEAEAKGVFSRSAKPLLADEQ